MDDYDYLTFIHDTYEFNDENSVANAVQFVEVQPPQIKGEKIIKRYRKIPRKPIVEILVFTLMPNHFHFIIRQLVDGGIVKFMQKLGTGYTMMFNKKYDRVGPLFQGRFKSVLVERQPHFMYLPYYIHLNPLDLVTCGGSTSTSTTKEKMIFLENYRWSSFQDYIGKKNFPSVTERDLILTSVGGTEAYKKAMNEFLVDEKEEQIKGFVSDVALDI